MSLHPPVLFIGDRPNPKKNLDMNVPFVGTKSYKTLLEWCYRMDIDVTNMFMLNAYTVDGRPIDFKLCHGWRHIALGDAAREALAKKTSNFFALPHPSGLNRELNDQKKLSALLTRCKAFIYKE